MVAVTTIRRRAGDAFQPLFERLAMARHLLSARARDQGAPGTTASPLGAPLCRSLELPKCDPGKFCYFAPEATCGEKGPGWCQGPAVCLTVSPPVCGCDGR